MRMVIFTLLTTALLSAPAVAEEMTLAKLLAAHYEAIGGLETLKSVQTVRYTAKVTGAMGEMPYVRALMRPNRLRDEFTLQGMTGVQAFDGETAWGIMPFMGKTDPEVLAEDQAKNLVEEADMDGRLVDWKAKGHKVELVGLEEVEGTEAYKVTTTLKNGEVRHDYLDSEYFVIIRQEGKTTLQGNEVEIETTLSDYKEVDGLMVPHSITTGMKDGPQQIITIEKVEHGVEFPEGYFSMPENADKTEDAEQPAD